MSTTEDYAAKGINLYLAAVAAGVYDDTSQAWVGPTAPESPVAFTLTYDTAADTVPNATYTTYTQTSSNTGVTNSTPYGYTTAAELEAIVTDVAGVLTAQGELAADVLALKKVLVAVINTLIAASLAT
jgi:hypothetical protein